MEDMEGLNDVWAHILNDNITFVEKKINKKFFKLYFYGKAV